MVNELHLGERPYIHQEIQTVQYGAVIGQVNMAHQPPMVSFELLFIYFIIFLSTPNILNANVNKNQ